MTLWVFNFETYPNGDLYGCVWKWSVPYNYAKMAIKCKTYQEISSWGILWNTLKYYSLAINNIERHFQTNPYLLQAARDQVSIGGNLQWGCLFYTPIKCDEQALIYLRYQSIWHQGWFCRVDKWPISIYFIHPGSVSTVEMLSADECGTQRCRKPLEKRGMKFVVSSCGKGQNFFILFYFW